MQNNYLAERRAVKTNRQGQVERVFEHLNDLTSTWVSQFSRIAESNEYYHRSRVMVTHYHVKLSAAHDIWVSIIVTRPAVIPMVVSLEVVAPWDVDDTRCT